MNNSSFRFAIVAVAGYSVFAAGLLGTMWQILDPGTGRALVMSGGSVGVVGLVISWFKSRHNIAD